MLAFSNAAFAITPVGPGEYRIGTSEDVSYVESGFSVPLGATLTVRQGIFCPDGGPKNVDEVIWRNVKLTDIESFTGRISYGSGDSYYWKDAGCYHVVTNETSGYVQCQLQAESSSIVHGFVIQYRQAGDDVKARITYARYAYNNSESQKLGVWDVTARGINIAVTNTPYVVSNTIRAIADLGFILREGAAASAAPVEIVFASTDETQSDEETYRYMPCLMGDRVTLCRNLRVADIVGMSGEISHSAINGGKWTPVEGVCRTNIGAAVQLNLIRKIGTRRIGANIRFNQSSADVQVCTLWAGHSYDDKEIEAPFGSGIIGVELGVTNEANTSRIAIRNLKVRFRPAARIVGDHEDCIVKEDGWTKLWPGVTLRDVTLGPALMGGYSLDSTWNVASNYLRTVGTYTDQSFYQYYASSGSTLYTIRFLMQQQFGDVYAKVASARYNTKSPTTDYPPGTSVGTGDYQTTVTNIVNGRAASGKTLAICHMTADLPVRKRHTVTVGDGFAPGLSPIRLDSMKLALAPSANASLPFESVVCGCGAIGVSGAGSVALKVNLPGTIGLEVDSGMAVIDAPRTAGGLVNVAAGASLAFVLADGSRPSLAARSFSMEAGSSIVLSSDTRVTDMPNEGETFKVVTGCSYADYALDGVICRTSGLLDMCKITRLFVDEDGDIAVTVKPRKGLLLTIQ